MVHNGIIENHDELRAELQKKGYGFESQTDTEVIAHLVHSLYEGESRGDLLDAVRRAATRLIGAYAIAVVAKSDPGTVVGARAGSPLVVGVGNGEHFLASDALALCRHHRPHRLPRGRRRRRHRPGRVARGGRRRARGDARSAHGENKRRGGELGPYRHFMQKEIFEQPRAVADTLESVAGIGPELFKARSDDLESVSSVLILACGTSYYAGLVARQWIEQLAGIRCNVEIASEYRYRAVCRTRRPWWW